MRAPTTAPRARTGCDLQRIDDVTDAIRDFGDRYLDRVYTPAEQEAGRLGGAASLAARFAAKEAVLKLIGTADGVDPREVEITHEDGRPVVRLSGLAATLAEEAGVGPIDVSLSHSGDHALAVAVAITQPSPAGRRTSMTQSVTDTIRGLLAEHARLGVDVASLSDTDDLYGAGMTSHASVTVMLACEDEWDLEFPQQMLKKSTFASVANIRDALAELGVDDASVASA